MIGAVIVLFLTATAELSSIGQTCDSKSTFMISNFESTPWPASAGVQLTISMAGTFKREDYISDILIKTSFNKGAWTYKYIDINQKFYYGQIYTFTFPVLAGTLNGEYRVQALLEQKQGSGISCWEFSYII